VTDLAAGSAVLRRRRYGVIEVVDELLVRIVLRPLPKLVSWPEARLLGRLRHALCQANSCRVYYNEPRSAPGFLALCYLVSTRGTTVRSVLGALAVLDEIARIKQSDALVCDVSNLRISDRLLARWGWAPLRPRWGHRNFIKRFYGSYPTADMARGTLERLSCDSSESADSMLESCAG
jgi:hypothetical protein